MGLCRPLMPAATTAVSRDGGGSQSSSGSPRRQPSIGTCDLSDTAKSGVGWEDVQHSACRPLDSGEQAGGRGSGPKAAATTVHQGPSRQERGRSGRHSQTKSEKERPAHRSCDSAHARDGESRKRVPGISVVFERTYILPITAISSRPISNSGCYYSVGTWKNPHMFPGTGAQVWCPGGTRLIHMQHALYWRRPGGSASLYMSSPITSWGYTSNTGQWGYVNVGCPLGSWQWQPSVLIWINNQYMGNFGGNWGGFTACVVLQP
jgi:hypothetical protein